MLPKYHTIIGLVIFCMFLLISPSIGILNAAILSLSSILMDFDHYLYYVIKKKEVSLIKAYNWLAELRKKSIQLPINERENYKRSIFIFHGIEFLTFLLVLSFINQIFIWILCGFMLHLFVDYIEIIYCKAPFYTKFSQTLVYIRNKNKKNLS